MTEDELESPQGCTPEALVEKVARAIGESLRTARLTLESEGYHPEARAAIAVLRPLVLEEAAKVAEAHMNPLDVRFGGDGIEIAAAIRALIETPPQGDK